MFGYRHLFEPYVPKEKRERGYFTMPLLAGGQIVGWVDPARSGQTLIARNLLMKNPRPSRPWRELWPRRPSGRVARMSVSNGPRLLNSASRF